MSDPQYEIKQWLGQKLAPRGTKVALSNAIGLTPDKVTRSIELESDDPKKRRALKLDELEAIARFFGELPPGFEGMTQWLASGSFGKEASRSEIPGFEDNRVQPPIAPDLASISRPKSNASFPPQYQEFPNRRSIPLLGQIEGGPNGKFIMNGTKIADVFCPPGLEMVPSAYAVRVYGTSMEPRFKAGETVWLNPGLPVRAGDDVVVQLRPERDGDEMASYIKEFRSRSSKVLRLWQHNPEEGEPHELEFDDQDVFSVHKVVHHSTL